jgi:purine-nucleoside phosphorylase
MTPDPYAAATASARLLAERTGVDRHDAVVVLGSGWRPAADALGTATAEVAVTDLGGFPPPTVPGHGGTVRSVPVGGRQVLVFLGRVHLYEGHPVATVVHGVRTAVAAGCRVVLLTNAAGGLRPDLSVGQPVVVRDHLNLTGASPLSGPAPPAGYPPRFVDLTDLYSARLRTLAREVEPALDEGVYAALRGPHYETVAEVAMLRRLGADLVGMSTALEAIAARHLGAAVLALSLVTNVAAAADHEVSHAAVVATGERAAAAAGPLLARILTRID